MSGNDQWLSDGWWLSPYNHAEEVREQFTLPPRVYIHDVTLREAMQSPRVCLRPEEKIRIAKALDKLGVYSIENGAYMSEVEKEVTAELVRMQRRGELKAKVTPLVHASERDVDIALETGADRVLISQSINPWIARAVYGTDEDELVRRLTRVVSYAKKNGLFVIAQVYDTYRAPLEFLERALKSLVYEGGADHIAISDTRGFALPWTVGFMVRKVKSWIPATPIEHHGHNDYGLATAMMAAAVVGGGADPCPPEPRGGGHHRHPPRIQQRPGTLLPAGRTGDLAGKTPTPAIPGGRHRGRRLPGGGAVHPRVSPPSA